MAPGLLRGCSLFQCYLPPVAVKLLVLFLLSSDFQPWRHQLRRVKGSQGLTRLQACWANGAGFVLSAITITPRRGYHDFRFKEEEPGYQEVKVRESKDCDSGLSDPKPQVLGGK